MRGHKLTVLFLLIAVAIISQWSKNSQPLYLLEDDKPELSELCPPPSHGPEVIYESTLEFDGLFLSGHRLSLPGEWSLQVGDEVSAFDRVLGFPFHAETSGNDGKAGALYGIDENLICSVLVDIETKRVVKLRLSGSNFCSIAYNPAYFSIPEAEKVPGFWLTCSSPWDGSPVSYPKTELNTR